MSIIRKLRTERQMTQEEFAGACGISRSSVARYESGQPISTKNGRKIHDAFGIPFDDLYHPSAEQPADAVPQSTDVVSQPTVAVPQLADAVPQDSSTIFQESKQLSNSLDELFEAGKKVQQILADHIRIQTEQQKK